MLFSDLSAKALYEFIASDKRAIWSLHLGLLDLKSEIYDASSETVFAL
jgi:hypothetical protein